MTEDARERSPVGEAARRRQEAERLRLAASLRENLARRKQQARARAVEEPSG